MIDSGLKNTDAHKKLVKEANLLKQTWTKIIERRVHLKEKGETIDVKVDALTASFRQKAVNLMLEAIRSESISRKEKDPTSVSNINTEQSDTNTRNLEAVKLVEKYLFISSSKRTNLTYRKSVRKLTFDLKSDKNSLTETLLQKSLCRNNYQSVAELIKNHLSK